MAELVRFAVATVSILTCFGLVACGDASHTIVLSCKGDGMDVPGQVTGVNLVAAEPELDGLMVTVGSVPFADRNPCDINLLLPQLYADCIVATSDGIVATIESVRIAEGTDVSALPDCVTVVD